jgi:hypothetical protein
VLLINGIVTAPSIFLNILNLVVAFMSLTQTEGIILKVLPFQDHDQIATLITPHSGIVKILLKKNQNNSSAVSPLIRGEFSLWIGKGDLHRCQQWTLIDSYAASRLDMDRLNASCSILKAIRDTQMPGKEAENLYILLIRYLEAINKTPVPLVFASSFLLKLLIYEGLFSLDSASFTLEEQEFLVALITCRSTAKLSEYKLPLELPKKIEDFFLSQIYRT